MLMVMGPHTALGNIPRSIEYNVDWVTRPDPLRARPRPDARRGHAPTAWHAWTDHVKKKGEGLLSNEVDSWMTGINRNVEGKQTPHHRRYSGSAPAFRERCDAVAADGYRELRLA